jgi:uncharacterized protein YfeS
MDEEDEEPYGIDRDHAHPRALELAPEDFFWNCADELAPFGSDEGDMALREFRDWRKENPTLPMLDCLIWTIEGVGEMDIEAYNDSLLVPATIQAQVANSDFDDAQYIYVLDVSILATGFGQLVDEGLIELEAKPLIQRAIDRQLLWSKFGGTPPPYEEEYHANLLVLNRILAQA